MKRIISVACFFFLLPVCMIMGEGVDREELGRVELGSVEFLNYEGPHDVINTRNEIIGIGSSMGIGVSPDFGTFRYHEKYRIIHAVGPEEEQGIPADIFVIEKEAQVDHIRNVRRIIAGYLASAYKYEFDDAQLIAEFITVYNAVYRGNMEMVSAKYSKTVLDNLEPSNIGISTRYDEWPGKTMMLIPLVGLKRGLQPGVVSSEEISSDEVIERLREDEDRGIDQRKGMVELRESEAEQEQQRIAEEQRNLEEEQKALREQERQLEEQVERAREEGTGDVREKEKGLAETREKIAETEERKAELEEEAQQQEERVERIRDERERIAEDEKAVTEEASAPREKPEVDTLFFMVAEKGGKVEGVFVRIDPVTGTVKKRAGNITVAGKTFLEYKGNILVAGSASSDLVTLLLMDEAKLEVLKSGTERVHPDTNITVSNSGIYAAVISSGDTYLGRFDNNLELADRSQIEIVPFSYIKPSGNTVLVQSVGGDIIVLNAETLEEE